MAEEFIRVLGARVHNLKNVSLDLPLNALTVMTGVSGSGKSSLAFDTIYAEGQRRYVESLSAYARQFLERMEKPAVDAIEGIAPAIAIRQKNATRNPRSTVGTATEIYDYLRLLFARAGRTICPHCGIPVLRDSVDQVAARLLESAAGRRAFALFPLSAQPGPPAAVVLEDADAAPVKPARVGKTTRVAARRAKAIAAPPAEAPHLRFQTRLFELRRKGFTRLYQDGLTVEFSTPESLLELDFHRPIHVIADRLVIAAEGRSRIVDAVESAYREAGEVRFEFPAEDERPALAALRFNERFECKQCGRHFEEPQPSLFSFNNPFGACPRCQGFGNTLDIAMEKVIPDPGKTLAEGAIEPWTKPKGKGWTTELRLAAKAAGIPLDVPWCDLSPAQQEVVLGGSGSFEGVRGFFAFLERKKYKLHVRVFLSRYRGYTRCPECHGTRLRAEARQVKLLAGNGAWRNIAEVCALTVGEAEAFFATLPLGAEQAAIAAQVLVEIRRRLGFLVKVGLDYLTLDRLAATLSGGEAQRIQLATCLGSHLVGALYVLDEPSIGLHPRDTQRLIEILLDLRDLGNTMLVVEHDLDVIRAADHLVDLGPGAGEQGGQITASGTVAAVTAAPASLTGRYLRGEARIPIPSVRRPPGKHRLRIRGAHSHNLKHLDVEIPLGLMVAVTGVSGSGKSTLIHEVLYQGLRTLATSSRAELANCAGIEGAEQVSEVVLVDQSPIGRTPRSNPVTYVKIFDSIRILFAQTSEARRHGYSAGSFSFNVPGGRCEVCQGDGVVTVEMQFLADVELVCEECRGMRFKSGVLEVTFRDKNIHEVLQLTVREATAFFAGHAKIVQRLKILEEVGLGYLRLGQSATTLSGGEAQRIKLAAHLAQPTTAARTLFLFDEPTTGLHLDDIAKLLAAFRRLLEAGASVVIIEHNLDLIKAVDWVIDLGPEGGARGGQVVAAGLPEEIARNKASYTGRYLSPLLKKER